MSRDTELAWAAGFFDGEGNSRFKEKKGGAGNFVISITQTDPFPLERVRLVMECGNVMGPYSSKKYKNHQQTYKYEVSGVQAISVLENMRPYLSIPKIIQGENAKQMYFKDRLARKQRKLQSALLAVE